MNQATLYTLLTSEDAEKYEDYILQGLLESEIFNIEETGQDR